MCATAPRCFWALAQSLPQCIEFRARYRLHACSRAHVLLRITLYCFFFIFGCLPSSAEHVPCAWMPPWPAAVSVHQHKHTAAHHFRSVCCVDFISFVDVMVFLFSGALKTYQIAIIFLFILFATRIQKKKTFPCRDSSFSDESLEYWITIQFYLVLFALAMLDKWQWLWHTMLDMLANLPLIKIHAHCARWPLEWELIRRSDDNNVMRSKANKKDLEQRLLLWPPSRAHGAAAAVACLHCMRRSIFYWWLNSAYFSPFYWNGIFEKPQRQRRLLRRTNFFLFHYQSQVMYALSWRQNIVTAHFRKKKSLLWSPINLYVYVSNYRRTIFRHRHLPPWRQMKRVTAACFDRLYSWCLLF